MTRERVKEVEDFRTLEKNYDECYDNLVKAVIYINKLTAPLCTAEIIQEALKFVNNLKYKDMSQYMNKAIELLEGSND